MNKYGIKGTFNINTELTGGENRLSMDKAYEVYTKGGVEVAVHGAKHIYVDNFPKSALMREFLVDKQNLENKFDTVIRGMAYAYGSVNDDAVDVLRGLGIVYGRTTKSTENFEIPNEFLRWNPTCHHANPKLFELVDEFLKDDVKLDVVIPKLFYLWGHSYEFNNANNWELIEEFCKKVSNNDNIWHATNIEIYDYVTAYINLSFSVDMSKVYNPSNIDVYLEINKCKVIAKAGEITKIG